jgi:excisionase family DNA binding protein
VSTEINISGPVSDSVSIPSVQVVIQPVLTFFKPIQATAAQVDGYLTAEQAAECIGVSTETVRRLCRKRAITYTAVTATDYRFTRAHLDEYLQSRTVKRKSVR